MYEDKGTCFSSDELWTFNNLLNYSHKQIHIKWITNLNDNSAVLTFMCQREQMHAEHKGALVDQEVWTILLSKVKEECTSEFCFQWLHLINNRG